MGHSDILTPGCMDMVHAIHSKILDYLSVISTIFHAHSEDGRGFLTCRVDHISYSFQRIKTGIEVHNLVLIVVLSK